MESKPKKEDPWKYINDALDNIEEYYGINFKQGFGSRLKSDIVNELLEFGAMQLPDTVYARCIDGKIRKGRRNQRLSIDMIAYRPVIKTHTMNKNQWETLLTKTDAVYTYCFDTQTFHPQIIPAVGLYMMNHQLSKNIYNIVLGNVKLSDPFGESAKVFDMYIRREKSITAKKEFFADQLDPDNNMNIKSDYFAWKYVTETLKKSESEPEPVQQVDDEHMKKLKQLASNQDLVLCDLVWRVQKGMYLEDAVKLCKDDCEKYGFKYSENAIRVNNSSGSYNIDGVNYNLMMYIKYLASTEELGGSIIEE